MEITPPPIHTHYNEHTEQAEPCGRVICPFGFVGIKKSDFENLNFKVDVRSTGIKICPCCRIADCKDEECIK